MYLKVCTLIAFVGFTAVNGCSNGHPARESSNKSISAGPGSESRSMLSLGRLQGEQLAVLYLDESLAIVDYPNRKSSQLAKGVAAFTTDGERLVAYITRSGRVSVHDTQSGVCKDVGEIRGPVYSLVLDKSENTCRLHVGCAEGAVESFDLTKQMGIGPFTATKRPVLLTGTRRSLTPDSRTEICVSQSSGIQTCEITPNIRFAGVGDTVWAATHNTIIYSRGSASGCIALRGITDVKTSGGSRLWVCSGGSVHVGDLEDLGRPFERVVSCPNGVVSIVVDPDGNSALVGLVDGRIERIELGTRHGNHLKT